MGGSKFLSSKAPVGFPVSSFVTPGFELEGRNSQTPLSSFICSVFCPHRFRLSQFIRLTQLLLGWFRQEASDKISVLATSGGKFCEIALRWIQQSSAETNISSLSRCKCTDLFAQTTSMPMVELLHPFLCSKSKPLLPIR